MVFLKKTLRQKGFALILVLSLTTAIMTIVSELLFQTEIISRSNLTVENRQRANTTMLSGWTLAQYLLKMHFFLEKALKEMAKQGQMPLDGILESLLGGKKVFELLNHVPLGGGMLDQLDALELDVSGLLAPELKDLIQTVEGHFVIRIQDISGLFNLNLLAVSSLREVAQEALTRLFSSQRDANYLFDRGLSGKQMAANVRDYIDPNQTIGAHTDGASEMGLFQELENRQPRNGLIPSMEDLRRLPPFHQDDIYEIFAPTLTVFPYPQSPYSASVPLININQASVSLISALMTPVGKEPIQKEFDALEESPKTFKEARDLASHFEESRKDEQTRDLASRLFGFESHTYQVDVKAYVGNIQKNILAIYKKVDENPMEPMKLEYVEFF